MNDAQKNTHTEETPNDRRSVCGWRGGMDTATIPVARSERDKNEGGGTVPKIFCSDPESATAAATCVRASRARAVASSELPFV